MADRYGPLNTHDLYKLVGIVLMVIDHFGTYIDDNMLCRLLGRAAAPCFFFLIGYSGKLRITMPLIIYAALLSGMGSVLWGGVWVNILAVFMATQVLLQYYPPHYIPPVWRSVLFLLALLFTGFTYQHIEYGALGVLIAYSGRMVAVEDPQATSALALSLAAYFIWQGVVFGFWEHAYGWGGLALMGGGLFWAFRDYQLHALGWGLPSVLSHCAMWLSRHSLAVYFYHLILLQIFFLVIHSG